MVGTLKYGTHKTHDVDTNGDDDDDDDNNNNNNNNNNNKTQLHGAESFLRSKQFLSYSRNSPRFMEPEGSLPHSQQPAPSSYPEPHQSSLCSSTHFSKIHFNIILPSMPVFSKWSPSLRFRHQNPICISAPPHVLHTPPISYLLSSFSVCSLLHSPVNSSFIGQNITTTTTNHVYSWQYSSDEIVILNKRSVWRYNNYTWQNDKQVLMHSTRTSTDQARARVCACVCARWSCVCVCVCLWREENITK